MLLSTVDCVSLIVINDTENEIGCVHSHESEGEKRNSSKKKTQLYESVYNSDSEEDGVSTSTSAVNDEIDTSSIEVHQAETAPLPQGRR